MWREVSLLVLVLVLGACSRPHVDSPTIVADPPKAGPSASIDAAAEVAPTAVKTGCTTNAQCELEPMTGTCHAGAGPRSVPPGASFCACDAGACKAEFVAKVACKTSLDCSWVEDPWRAVPASKVPRPSPPVVPCSTGSRDVVCDAGSCVLRHWKC